MPNGNDFSVSVFQGHALSNKMKYFTSKVDVTEHLEDVTRIPMA